MINLVFERGVPELIWTCQREGGAARFWLEWAIDKPEPPYYFQFRFS